MILLNYLREGHGGTRHALATLIIASGWTIYVFLGALAFFAIERPVTVEQKEKIRTMKENFLRGNHCMEEADLERFIQAIEYGARLGVSASLNVTGDATWSFANAVFFAGTLITTIGYGNTAPLSDSAKVFCIFYAGIGVPLTLIMFTALVERLMIPTSLLLQFLVDKLVPKGVQPFHIRLTHLGILVVVILVFLVLIPAAVFNSYEPNWTYLDAFYFCVVSLMTIGLGDVVPGEDPSVNYDPGYKFATTFYIAVGLLFVMLLLAVVYEIPEFNLGLHLSMRSDEFDEKGEDVRLTGVGVALPPRYMTQIDETPDSAAPNGNSINGRHPPPVPTSAAPEPVQPPARRGANDDWSRS